MTLVAAFLIDDQPVVLGDILISSNLDIFKIEKTPTGHDVKSEGTELPVIHIVDVAQKVTVIDESCVIAWSGSYTEAATVISDLIGINEIEPLTRERINDYFENEIGNTYPISFVGCVRGADSYQLFEYCAEKVSSKEFGDFYVAGSGYPDLKRLVSESNFTHDFHGNGGADDYQQAISKVLGIVGPLLTNEIITGDTLKHGS